MVISTDRSWPVRPCWPLWFVSTHRKHAASQSKSDFDFRIVKLTIVTSTRARKRTQVQPRCTLCHNILSCVPNPYLYVMCVIVLQNNERPQSSQRQSFKTVGVFFSFSLSQDQNHPEKWRPLASLYDRSRWSARLRPTTLQDRRGAPNRRPSSAPSHVYFGPRWKAIL